MGLYDTSSKMFTWIPCEERMPDEDLSTKLVTIEYSDGTRMVATLMYSKNKNMFLIDKLKCIAWMDLPDAYTEELV